MKDITTFAMQATIMALVAALVVAGLAYLQRQTWTAVIMGVFTFIWTATWGYGVLWGAQAITAPDYVKWALVAFLILILPLGLNFLLDLQWKRSYSTQVLAGVVGVALAIMAFYMVKQFNFHWPSFTAVLQRPWPW